MPTPRAVRRYWFLISLAAVLLLGIAAAPTLAPWTQPFPRWLLVAAILFVTALPVSLGRMAAAPGAVRAIGLATFINAGVAPVLGFAASLALPAELSAGVFVAAASPCTMASAAVWTRRGGGNDAVALAVTLLTSLGCFLVLPGWGWLLLGERIAIDPFGLMAKLLACVAAPVAVAQLLRRAPEVARFAAHHKPGLSVSGQLGVLGIVLLGSVDAGVELRRLSEPIAAAAWPTVLFTAAGLHAVLLALGWWGAKAIGAPRAERVAAAIAGSQKTLAVGVGTAAEFGPLALLPMIAYHAVQLVIDTPFVDRVRKPPPRP